MIKLLVVSSLFIVFVYAQIKPPTMPPVWPNQFETIQTQYWPQNGNAKQQSYWWYDYTNFRHRFDHHTITNGAFNAFPTNSSEIWTGDDLYMYNWDTFTCSHLYMGFGIPRPDWFISGSEVYNQYEWLYRNDTYHKTIQVSKPSPYSNFNYYAFANSGVAFRLEAPGPVGLIVVNDFIDFTAKTPNPEQFVLPAEPVCDSVYW